MKTLSLNALALALSLTACTPAMLSDQSTSGQASAGAAASSDPSLSATDFSRSIWATGVWANDPHFIAPR